MHKLNKIFKFLYKINIDIINNGSMEVRRAIYDFDKIALSKRPQSKKYC